MIGFAGATILNAIVIISMIIILVSINIFKLIRYILKKQPRYQHLKNFKIIFFPIEKFISIFLSIIMIICLILLILRPHHGIQYSSSFSGNYDICFVIDTSLSMNTQDMSNISRIDYAKEKLTSSLDQDLFGYRYCLVTFTHKAFVDLPLTEDINTLKTGINTLTTIDYFYARGSDMSQGLSEAKKRLSVNINDLQSRPKIIILISDGEQITPENVDIDKTIDELNKENIIIYTVGVGTKEGGKIPTWTDTYTGKTYYAYDPDGGDAISKLDESYLEKISKQGKGNYFFIDDLSDLSKDLKSNELSQIKGGEYTVYKEIYFIFVWISLFSLILLRYLDKFFIRPIYKR